MPGNLPPAHDVPTDAPDRAEIVAPASGLNRRARIQKESIMSDVVADSAEFKDLTDGGSALAGADIPSLHSAARQYVASGIPVFPCVAGSKRPATPNGFHDATLDPAQIDAWWTKDPNFNIAFTPHSVGWGIVDIDSPAAELAYNERDAAEGGEPTWTIKTPRGGLHLYYEGELPTSVGGGGTKGRIIPGQPIDTRGNGSYALLPPSRTADGVYSTYVEADIAPMPEWVKQAIIDSDHGGAITTAPDVELDLPANVARAVAHLRTARPAIEGQGGNERTFVVAAELRDLGISKEKALELMEPWNERCEPPWDEDELQTVMGNAYAYAQNSPGVHAVTGSPSEAFGKVLNLPVDRIIKPEVARETIQKPRFVVHDAHDWDALEDPAWLVEGLIPQIATGSLIGDSQAGKTFLVIDYAVAVASGKPFLGKYAVLKPGPVVIAEAEGYASLVKKRLPARFKASGLRPEAVPVYTVEGVPLASDPSDPDEFVTAIRDKLASVHREGGGSGPAPNPALIIIDTKAKSMVGMSESDQKDIGKFVVLKERLKLAFGCAVMSIGHTGLSDDERERGGQGIFQGDDFSQLLKWHEDKQLGQIINKKQRDDEKPTDIWIRRKVVPAGDKTTLILELAPAPVGGNSRIAGREKAIEDDRKKIMRLLRAGRHFSANASLTQATLAKMLAGDPASHVTKSDYDRAHAHWTKRLDNGHVNRSKKDLDKLPPLYGCFHDGIANEFDPNPKTMIKWYRSPEMEPWEEQEAQEQAETNLIAD
jgi:Bifunctional DNA primase/polymerase, N-terminal/AAA domain